MDTEGTPPPIPIYLIRSLLFALIVYVLRIIYMSRFTLALYASIALLLHVPFDCPLALLPLLMPEEQIEIVSLV